jgi:hypothetical protein
MAPRELGNKGHYLLVGLFTSFGTHMRLMVVLLHKPGSLQESSPLLIPWHEPLFSAPTTSDSLETPRDQRTPEEIAFYLKSRYRPTQQPGKKTQELRWFATRLTSDPTEDSAPRYSDWEACASLFVAIDILTHDDGIRHSSFEGHTIETTRDLLVLVAYALQFL